MAEETNSSKTKTTYLRVWGKRPRVVTLVYTLEKKPTGEAFTQIGYSICNCTHDSFEKKKGRLIALGRLKQCPIELVYPADEKLETWSDRRSYILETLADWESLPRQLSKAVHDFYWGAIRDVRV